MSFMSSTYAMLLDRDQKENNRSYFELVQWLYNLIYFLLNMQTISAIE
jgi:hypothetical protein